MPSASPELQTAWETDDKAIKHLEKAGYILNRDWTWSHPIISNLEAMHRQDFEALMHLVHEWDFGGLKVCD